MGISASRFAFAPLLTSCLAAFCLSAPIRRDGGIDFGRAGSAAGSPASRHAQATSESPAAAIGQDADVLKLAAAQEGLGLWYEARRTLARAAGSTRNLELLRRHAAVEDQYGERAGAAYRQLAEACEAADSRPADYADLLQRGLVVSLRDQDPGLAEWFSGRLQAAGRGGFVSLFDSHIPAVSDDAVVPGGAGAALRLAGAQETVRPEHFLSAFCRRIEAFDAAFAARFRDQASDYFRRVRALKALGVSYGNRAVIRLGTETAESLRRTKKVLQLLGWEMEATGRQAVVKPAESESAFGGQMTAAALNIDEIGMQEALQSGRSIDFEITDDRVPIFLGESGWFRAFCGNKAPPGGITEVMAADQRVARLYLGLSAQDPQTARRLAQDPGLRTLAGDYSDLLLLYSSAFAMAGGRAAVPGGVEAESVWQELVGAQPGQPSAFFPALLRKDGGKLLAFYASLMEFDVPRQRFFVASLARAAKFRDLVKLHLAFGEGSQPRHRRVAIMDFMARLPISSEGKVMFPGSAQLWMDAARKPGPNRNPGDRLPDLLRGTSPEVEDAILLQLARAGSPAGPGALSRLASLVAIAWVDNHRKVPLDEASVVLLAHEYPRLQWIWPYLASLTGLQSEDVSTLKLLERRFRDLDKLPRNDALGEWDALAKMISILGEAGTLTQEDAALLFRSLCRRFLLAASPADYATASLETMRELIQAASAEDSSPDDAIQDLLLGKQAPFSLHGGGMALAAGASDSPRRNYREVLKLQKVPDLQTLLAINQAARRIKLEPEAAAGWLTVLEAGVRGLEKTGLHSDPGATGDFRDVPQSFRVSRGIRAVQEIRRLLANGAPDPGKVAALTEELMSSLNPQVRLALTGVIYARYLSPGDALVANDPLLLRKHRFGWFESARADSAFPISELVRGRDGGSYIQGGFADFSRTAGEITMATHPEVEESARPAGAIIIGSLRDTPWQALRDADLRWIGLKIRTAREWILRAAIDEISREELERATLGILSPNRRGRLFQALERRDWGSVWRQVTLSDLYFLCDAYLEMNHRDELSPTVRALRAFQPTANPARLRWFGQDLQTLLGCSHPHLVQLPPYEYYEQSLLPARLAARAGEYKLYLAEFFDRHGLPASLLGVVAEPLAIELMTRMHLSDVWDWQALQNAFHGLNLELLDKVLQSQ